MSDEQRQAAIEARAQAQKTAAAGSGSAGGGTGGGAQNGLAGLLAPMPGRGMGTPGGRGNAGQANAAQRQGGGNAQGTGNRAARTAPRPLWFIAADGKPDCILVRTGISNGINTEVSPVRQFRAESGSESDTGTAGDLEGMKIILREKI
jgi:hypothetical protein